LKEIRILVDLIELSSNFQCQSCRFAKCIEANMRREGKETIRKIPPDDPSPSFISSTQQTKLRQIFSISQFIFALLCIISSLDC
jgi:hypothetical protein